ncbi:four helix bundle protein [Rheinheimera sp. WS51]|uniref:four helix bundle protein n=1 Tax=Rheinheimera sp. WS51 TaxID=3425886 RepID=UPI003D8BD6A8
MHYDLKVWQLSMDLVVDIYAFTKLFPDSERYGLSSQIQRAAVSVPSNIAEGAGRGVG